MTLVKTADKDTMELAAALTTKHGRDWIGQICKRHTNDEIAGLAGVSGTTIGYLRRGAHRQHFETRLKIAPVLERLAKEDGLPPLILRPGDLPQPSETDAQSPEQSVEKNGQVRLDVGVDVTPAAWLRDLIALHHAIGNHELVSGPKVKSVLRQIIHDLGGEV